MSMTPGWATMTPRSNAGSAAARSPTTSRAGDDWKRSRWQNEEGTRSSSGKRTATTSLTDPPRQRTVEREPFTAEEARALLAAAESDRLAVLYRLALTLGLRRGELLGLRWQDVVHLEVGRIRLARTLQRVNGEIVLKEPKTERSRRTLALGPAPVAALRAHRERQAWERKAAGAK